MSNHLWVLLIIRSLDTDEHITQNSESKLPLPILIFYTIILIGLIGIAAFSYNMLKKPIIKEKSFQISSIAKLKIQQISEFRTRRIRDVQFFYGNQTFIRTVQKLIKHRDPETVSELNDWLKPLVNDFFYDEISIINASDGTNLLDIRLDTLLHSFKSEPSDLDCLRSDSIKFGDLIMDETEKRIHLDILLPLTIKRGSSIEKVGVIKFVLNPYKKLYKLMQSMPDSGETGEVLVVRKDGEDVLYINELRFLKNSALKLRLPAGSKELPAARALSGKEGIEEGIDYRGKRVLALGQMIPGTNWALVVKFDTEEIYTEIQTLGFLIIGMLAILIIAFGFGLTILWERKRLNYYKSRINDLNTINHLNHIYKLLIDIERTISVNNDSEKLLNDSCQIVSNEGSYSLCWIGMINEQTGYLSPIQECLDRQKYLKTIENIICEKVADNPDPALSAVIKGKSFISNNIWIESELEGWREKAIPEEFKSIAVFPLKNNSKTIGVIYFYSDKKGFFVKDEITLLERLSEDLSYGLEKIELEQKEKKFKDNLLANEKKLKKQNEELAIAREKAEESERLKSAFLANMSHEIRTPMNSIIGFADLLIESDLNKETHEYCNIIVKQTNYLLQIINDILDISKLDSRTVTINPEIVNLNKFLDELNVIYSNKITSCNKKINLAGKKTPGDIQLNISTDIIKFRQIFTNLLENAIKFTDSGEISFGYYNHNAERLTCFVSDTGIGIEPKYQEEIFEIFRQAKTTSKRKYGGTGLGLAICKGNALLLGGDIWVRSEPGNGSTFYFSVNYKMEEDRSSKSFGKYASPEILRPEHNDKLWKTKKVLLVEDDESTIEFLKILFSQIGTQLLIARNGKEAEDYYGRLNDIDMVLLDMNLPDTNGFNLVKGMKSVRTDIPVIAQTALTIEDNGNDFLKAGCDAYLSKPYNRRQILNMMTTFMRS